MKFHTNKIQMDIYVTYIVTNKNKKKWKKTKVMVIKIVSILIIIKVKERKIKKNNNVVHKVMSSKSILI